VSSAFGGASVGTVRRPGNGVEPWRPRELGTHERDRVQYCFVGISPVCDRAYFYGFLATQADTFCESRSIFRVPIFLTEPAHSPIGSEKSLVGYPGAIPWILSPILPNVI